MFENLRWRIAAWFVFLTSIAFAILVAVAAQLFHDALTGSIDEHLQQICTEIQENVVYVNDSIEIKKSVLSQDTDPYLLLTSVQLYDTSGNLLRHYGRSGIFVLSLKQQEVGDPPSHQERCLVKPLKLGDKLVGYLQLQYPTRIRNRAIRQFITVMALIAPVLVMLLGILAYIFERITTRPLEQTFQLLQTFLADAGHELKTPVSVMQSTIENVARKRSEDEWLVKRVEVLSRALERMNHLVQDILTLSDLESKQLLTTGKQIRIDQCVHDVVEEMQEMFEKKSVALSMKELQQAVVLGDPEDIHRVISNLLSNALRYTDSGGSVTVSVAQIGRSVKVSVSDTGIGMSQEQVARIFDRFYRADKSRSRALGGSGLGLSIVKSIVTGLKGSIDVKSELGKGSEFIVTLPFRPSAGSS